MRRKRSPPQATTSLSLRGKPYGPAGLVPLLPGEHQSLPRRWWGQAETTLNFPSSARSCCTRAGETLSAAVRSARERGPSPRRPRSSSTRSAVDLLCPRRRLRSAAVVRLGLPVLVARDRSPRLPLLASVCAERLSRSRLVGACVSARSSAVSRESLRAPPRAGPRAPCGQRPTLRLSANSGSHFSSSSWAWEKEVRHRDYTQRLTRAGSRPRLSKRAVTLTNVLPGFRQIRAPLAAGYLWLLFIYLVADLGQVRPESGIVKEIADLGSNLSPVGVAVAVSFAAYLTGSLSMWLGRWLLSLASPFDEEPPKRLSARGWGALEDLLAPRVAPGTGVSLEEAKRLGREVMQELDLIKTRLLGQEPELHSEIDRLHGEADFRFAVLPPLLGVGIVGVLAIPIDTGDLFWNVLITFLLVVGVIGLIEVLAAQGISVWAQANDKLVDAVLLNRADSPALERWDREKDIPR